jgi:hypothetical protein
MRCPRRLVGGQSTEVARGQRGTRPGTGFQFSTLTSSEPHNRPPPSLSADQRPEPKGEIHRRQVRVSRNRKRQVSHSRVKTPDHDHRIVRSAREETSMVRPSHRQHRPCPRQLRSSSSSVASTRCKHSLQPPEPLCRLRSREYTTLSLRAHLCAPTWCREVCGWLHRPRRLDRV